MHLDVVAEGAHPDRVVPRSLEREPEGRASEIEDAHEREHRDRQRDVIEGRRVRDGVAEETRQFNVVHAPVTRELGHLAEEVEDHDPEREGDHQEVDPLAARRDRAEDQADDDSSDDSDQDREPRIDRRRDPPVGGDQVRHREPRDPEHAHLGERDHAAVAREEDHAHRHQPEPEGLRQEHAIEEVGEDQRREQQHRGHESHAQPPESGHAARGGGAHAGLPKSPYGRTARTATTSPNVSRIE